MREDHGYARYSAHGDAACRCEVCCAAKAEYMRERRAEARRIAQLSPGRYVRRHAGRDVKHGTSFAYFEVGCRCRACQAWAASEARHRRKNRRDAA